MVKWVTLKAYLLLISFGFFSCQLNSSIEPRYFLSLKVDPYFETMDSVTITVLSPLRDTVEVLWHGRTPSTEILNRLPTRKFKGGAAIVSLNGFKDEFLAYKLMAHYSGASTIREITSSLFPKKDAWVDTSRIDSANFGYTAMGYLSGNPDSTFFCLQFDWKRIVQNRLLSATLSMNTFAPNLSNTGKSILQNWRIQVMKRNWTEGTGNAYRYGEAWYDSGQLRLSHYPMHSKMNRFSTDPHMGGGIDASQKYLFWPNSLGDQDAGSATLNLTYPYIGETLEIPKPSNLLPIDIDVTDYVKNAQFTDSTGFLLTLTSTDALGLCTKELGDGIYGPELILKYSGIGFPQDN